MYINRQRFSVPISGPISRAKRLQAQGLKFEEELRRQEAAEAAAEVATFGSSAAWPCPYVSARRLGGSTPAGAEASKVFSNILSMSARVSEVLPVFKVTAPPYAFHCRPDGSLTKAPR
jgi:hypothetical protein